MENNNSDLLEKLFEDIPDDSNATGFHKYQITINNPENHGFSRESVIEICKKKKWTYCAFSHEIGGKEGTDHFHLFIYNKHAIALQTIRNLFPKMHYEICHGNCVQNMQYVFKLGKWADTEKGLTTIPESHWEQGECPVEKPGRRVDLEDLYNAVKEGKSNFEILESYPQAMRHLEMLDRTRELLHSEKYSKEFRQLKVYYVWGTTEAGKTRFVYDTYGFANVHRVSDYDHPFDSYKGQDVLVLDEYRSDFKVRLLLNLLDGYPLELSARFFDRWACYHKVIIISNISLSQQYKHIQEDEPETWKAILRRIHKVIHFTGDCIQEIPMEQWRINPGHYDSVENPFE